MTSLLCLDPAAGVSGASGVAYFDGGILVDAAIIRRPDAPTDFMAWYRIARAVVEWSTFFDGPDVFVAEWPFVYPDEKKVNPNRDLLPLGGVVAHVSGMLPESVTRVVYLPREWKGSLQKKAFSDRIYSRLSPQERAVVDAVNPPSLRHNALDAVGLGLKYLNRLEPVKVFARE